MLRVTRLAPGRRALLPHPHLPVHNTAAPATSRPVTFVTGKSNTTRPVIFTSMNGGTPKPKPSVARPLSAWGPSTMSTLALGSILGGSWYIWEAGRDYMVGPEADRHEPRVLGTHREGKVNRDYVNYDQWVERHRHGRRGRERGGE
ncbi:uncharacterized protein B0H64DRAFT_395085 [Chaetomium fimeti]|uniref:Uncharacterized protein n=1 Tax=Chaetomium fimeti TaxID=1854472 RepID=A0AAE0LS80_9PEZI|nr:hypothetical protein B0H64DRAFT_395085 [Chaetomium fimeti]